MAQRRDLWVNPEIEVSSTAPAMHFNTLLEPVEEATRKRQRLLELLGKFRVATKTIVAANRFKLVLEVEAEKPQQAVNDFVALFSRTTIQEQPSSEGSLVACRPEELCTAYPRDDEEMIPLSDAIDSDGSLSIPNQGNPTQVREKIGENEMDGIACCKEVFEEVEEWPLAELFKEYSNAGLDELFKEGEECPGSPDNWFAESLQVATRSISNRNDAIHGGTSNQLSTETTMPDHLLADDFPMLDIQVPQVEDMQCDWTHSGSKATREGDDGTQNGQHDQERRGSPDLESQLKLLQKGQECPKWEELVSNMKKGIAREFGEIDQVPHRLKLRHMKEEAEVASRKLHCSVDKFKGFLEKFFTKLRRIVDTISSNSPLLPGANGGQQQLTIAIELFKRNALKTLGKVTGSVCSKLDNIARELEMRELTAINLFQNCASSISVLVESFLGEQSSSFISVADFRDWYLQSVYI